MANTYFKIYLHLVFAVKGRQALLSKDAISRLHPYMASTIKDMGHFAIAVGGISNHVHILLSYNPNQSIPDLVRELKISATKFVNTHSLTQYHFEWQRGYSCFSYSHSQIERVRNYILNQEAHHTSRSLKDEITLLYQGFGINYDERFIFEE